MELEKKSNEAYQLKISILIGIITVFFFYFKSAQWSAEGRFSNIKIYIMSIVLFFAVFTVSMAVQVYNIILIKNSIIFSKIVAIMIIPGGGYYLACCYFYELDKYSFPARYLRHNVPIIIYVVILALFTCVVYLLLKNSNCRKNFWRLIFALLVALIQGWFLYTANPFKDNGGGIYHIDAYTNSIINALEYSPFEMYSASIYGHYGLLYLIPIKIIQKLGFGDWSAVTIAIAGVGFVTFLLEYWCINQVIRNDAIYGIAILANAVVSFQINYNQYYQMLPHRYVFQSVILCGCILAYRKSKLRVMRIAMCIIVSFAFIWNFEIGAVAGIVWTIASVYLDRRAEGKYTVRCILFKVGYLLLSFVVAYGIVNIYNLIVGGNIVSIKAFIYPYGSDAYKIKNLQLTLMKPLCGYFIVIAVTLGVIALYSLKVLYATIDEKEYVAFLAGIMGVGVFTYYMNRAVTSNASIVGFCMVILLSHISDKLLPFIMPEKKQKKPIGAYLWDMIKIRNIVGVFCLTVLASMALSSISEVGRTLYNKIETIWETESLSDFLQEADVKIPDNAVAFGPYTAQLYALLNRSTGIYIADWEDIGANKDAVEKLKKMCQDNKYENIVISLGYEGYLPEGEYSRIDSMKYEGMCFEIYKRLNYRN